jgi:hypothetical protein
MTLTRTLRRDASELRGLLWVTGGHCLWSVIRDIRMRLGAAGGRRDCSRLALAGAVSQAAPSARPYRLVRPKGVGRYAASGTARALARPSPAEQGWSGWRGVGPAHAVDLQRQQPSRRSPRPSIPSGSSTTPRAPTSCVIAAAARPSRSRCGRARRRCGPARRRRTSSAATLPDLPGGTVQSVERYEVALFEQF